MLTSALSKAVKARGISAESAAALRAIAKTMESAVPVAAAPAVSEVLHNDYEEEGEDDDEAASSGY